jgi:hypothetical protein
MSADWWQAQQLLEQVQHDCALLEDEGYEIQVAEAEVVKADARFEADFGRIFEGGDDGKE